MSQRTSEPPPPRFSVSQLSADIDPEEKDFARQLTQALAPSFVLVKRLGAGGMGAVYLARDPVLRRLVAVKVMAPALAADQAARARFEREAQAVAAISHPNVVSVYSVGELANGVPFLVMQYIEGRTMAERLTGDGPLDARTAKRVIGEVASALAAAHRKGIIHRDIKPANILWDDETGRAMVTDFGIAAVLEKGSEGREAVQITHTGMAIGTPAYMSPEQLLAEPVTERSDIYSLGLLGYELFIGEGPYQVSSPREMMAAHLRDVPRRLSTMRGDVDPELERLLESCLSKDPLQRPTAAEVERRLEHGASILLEWPPPGLEKLRASLRVALRVLLIGAFACGIPLVLISVFDRQSVVRQSMPPTLVMLVLTGIGLITFGAGLVALGVFLKQARQKVAAGYGWFTLLETVADQRGDTGALIAGGREYAELEPATRSTMRRNRVLALAFRVVAALLPVLGYVAGVMAAAGSPNGPTIVLWSSILLSFTLLAAAEMVRSQEDRVMKEPRRRLRSAAALSGTAENLAETWTESFDQVRTGQRFGSGPRWHGRPIKAIAWGSIALAVGAGALMFAIFTLTTLIGIAGEIGVPKFSNTTSKVARIARLAEYRVPPDSSISPLRAGQALHAISRNGPGGALVRYERAPAITIPPQRPATNLQDPFPGTDGGWISHAFRLARRGFTTQQRDFLRATADNTAIEEFRILARAPGLDLPGAYWELEPGAWWASLPIPKFTPVRAAANANLAQAALDLAAGRTPDAERRLRENVSVGFLMIAEGRTLFENLIGTTVVGTARTAMTAFYESTGRARDARFVSTVSDPELPVTEPDARRANLEEIQRMVRSRILDSTSLLGLRWELFLGFLAVEPCTDLHQVVFGPDSLHRATVEEARRRLVRRPSDSVLFALVEIDKIRPITAEGSRGRAVRATRPVTRAASFLTGNRQLEACLSLFGGY